MQPRNRTFSRLLDAAQHRFRRARPGSVLIMVVSLLVLLALIGTAAMSTSRLDRTSSLQNVKNVQVDLLAEGVKRMVLGILSKDASAANTTDSTMFDPDVPMKDEANAILASLLPERQLTRNPGTGKADFVTAPPKPDQLVFRAPSYPPVQTGTQAGFPYRFNDPTESDPTTNPNYYSLPNPKPAMFPTVTVVNGVVYPALQAVNVDGTAMNFFPNANGTPSTVAFRGGEKPFIAADTDADGVADAMLVKLPITPISGITYYAAVRVVDNSAKLNLNTAANADNEHAPVQVRNAAGAVTNVDLSFAGIYPASVMLENLLDPTTTDTREPGNLTELDKLNGQRVYGQRLWGKNAVASANPYYFDPITGNPAQRTDFTFLTPGDAMYNNLARMLDYPSISVNPNSKDPLNKPGLFGGGTRPFAIADSMALAYRFTLINPASQDSIVEKSLFMATLTARNDTNNFKPAINKPYPLTAGTPGSGVSRWFDDNFDFRWKSETPADQVSWLAGKAQMMRALLTGFNPVSASVPKTNVQADLYRMWYVAQYNGVDPGFPNNPPPATPPAPDDYVAPKIPDATDPIQRQPMAPLPLTPTRGPTMRNPSGLQYPGKANVNTAQFEELWQRYFDVMCNDATSSPFDFGAEDDIYQGSSFNHLTPFGNNLAEHAARMFRSPLRPEIPAPYSPKIARMHPYQVMALRAAIAAANTIALRTDFDPPGSTMINDRNIPFFEIVLPQVNATYDHTTYVGAGANPPPNFYAGVGATVYGVKRQPFITEVFLNNNTEQYPNGASVAVQNPDGSPVRNRSGFAAIEIHNPYDRPFRLSGWKLGLVDRRRVNDAGNTVVDWQNQTDAAGNRRVPRMQVVDLPDNTTPDTWDAEKPNAAAYAPFIFDGNAVIPPHGFLVVSNLPPVTQFDKDVLDAAQYSPAGTKIDALPAGVTSVYARKLHWMMNREIQLFRPVERQLFDTGNVPNPKGVWVVRWAPADSFDATGIAHKKFDPANPPPPPLPGDPPPAAEAWHYVRSNDPANNRAWHFVYPGRYEALAGTNIGGHQQGTDRDTWDPTAAGDAGLGTWATAIPTTPAQFGLLDAHNTRDTGRDYSTGLNTNPVVSTFPIQIANSDLATQFVATGASPGPAFPLNGFARSGDLMQVTYIGSYTMWDADARWTRDDLPATEQFDAEYWSKAGAENTTNKTPPTLPFLAGGGGRFIDINPVSMDAAMAEDTDVDDDYKPSTSLAFEDVGRFVPLYFDPVAETTTTYSLPFVDLNAYKANGTATNQAITDTFNPDPNPPRDLQSLYPKDFWVGYDCIFFNADQTATATWKVQHRRVTQWDNASNTIKLDSPLTFPIPSDGKAYAFALQRVRYEWAAKLPNYFSTQYTPADDYLPNVDPTSGYLPVPLKVKNLSDPSRQINRDGLFITPQQRAEDDVPAEGLININTANWKVISQLPLVMNVAATPPVVDQPATEALARRIVYYRDVDDGRGIDPTNATNHPPHPHGPFKSLYELCLIPEFVNAMNTIDNTNLQANNPGVVQGDFSPMSLNGDLVRQDFKEKYLSLNRIANLVTLKSDCFTVYLQVQGWREAGTTSAKLVTQKRLSFIVDRSQTDKRSPTVYNVPVAE